MGFLSKIKKRLKKVGQKAEKKLHKVGEKIKEHKKGILTGLGIVTGVSALAGFLPSILGGGGKQQPDEEGLAGNTGGGASSGAELAADREADAGERSRESLRARLGLGEEGALAKAGQRVAEITGIPRGAVAAVAVAAAALLLWFVFRKST